MTNYTIDYIYNIKNNIDLKLDDSISKLLIAIEYEIDKTSLIYLDDKNKLGKTKYKNKKYFNDNFEKNEKILEKNLNKSDIHLNKDFFKKIINKISINNFDKLFNEFIVNYKRLDHIYDKYIINEINLSILKNMILNNTIFFDLYCKILLDLSKINYDILNNLDVYKTIFKDLFENIKINNINNCDNISQEEEVIIYKKNDEIKHIGIFFINCYKYNIVDKEFIYNSLFDLQNHLLKEINKENNKFFAETIVEFLNLFLTEIINKSIYKEIDIDNKLYENISLIANSKRDSYISITNKIIFKFKDIIDKIILSF